MFTDCIIMAGGSGSRLWPASSSRNPKQFLPMPSISDTPEPFVRGSFLNAAIERALALIDRQRDGRVIIIAGHSHVARIVKDCEKYSSKELQHLVLIPEPAAKSTAPAIACAATFIDWASGEERKILVLTSDHIITPMEKFLVDAAAAEAFVQADKLVIFGITPQGPETGYGYIEAGIPLSQVAEEPDVFKVLSFREKPDQKTAETFLQAGNFYWNSGMFAFSSTFILKEFRRSAAELIFPFGKLRAPDQRSFRTEGGLRILWNWLDLDKAYRHTRAISFDYAIAEKCSGAVMVKAGFKWIDVGSWDEYALLIKRSGLSRSEVYQCESRECFVDSDIPVALVGVEDLIITVRSGKDGGPGSVLVAKRGQTQKVREIVEQIKANGRNELL
ncbi:MAG: mannose-1-phosphate guanylyltransferase [Spirochaetaceae bacterium]|jgi:mannose-1-phosphate guanylyltransferase/mannose-1-phosphate guanylyltransferase/mannose-6-phosphate isomerase|nr:mannose-1-phosphate guanylyltransferase [Spirochaetaceae bacterium]